MLRKNPTSPISPWIVSLAILASTSVLLAQTRPTDDAAAERAAIQHLIDSPSAAECSDHLDRMLREADDHAYRIDCIDRFLARYPRDEAAARFTLAKLDSLYLMATLRGQDFSRLSAELARIDDASASATVRETADLMRMRLRLADAQRARRSGGPNPAASMPSMDAETAVAGRFIREHADASAIVPVLERRVEDCFADGDMTAEPWLGLLQRHHPEHVTTIALMGRQRLLAGVGQPWRPQLQTIDGAPLAWDQYAGKAIVVVFWASRHHPSLEILRRISDARSDAPAIKPQVVAIAIDSDVEAVRHCQTALNADVIVCCDGRGWASPLAATYGIRVLPVVLLLDGQGTLQAVLGGDRILTTRELDSAMSEVCGDASSQPTATSPASAESLDATNRVKP